MMIPNLLKERRLEPRRDPMLDFAVKDTWRIFRIMGEFVEGFETLSQVKGVAIFGSARSLPGSADYQRMYQLIRQPGPIADRRFEIEYLDTGIEAFVFTFG